MPDVMKDSRLGRVQLPDSLPSRLGVFFESHVRKNRFFNPWAEFHRPKLKDIMRWQMTANPARKIKRSPPSIEPLVSLPAPRSEEDQSTVTWLGHASFLVETGTTRTVFDPIFGHMMGGSIRRQCSAPYSPEELGNLDVVCITHGHYDHLDKPSVERLARHNPNALFCVPLGMAGLLPKACKHAIEFDWWDELEWKGVRYSFVPAQHWHRRGLFDLNRVLWGGWVVTGKHSVYHSGDTGFFPGFEAIGAVFPTIDVALLPLGAYEPAWFMGPQHMAPDDSVRAFGLLDARYFLGMHWGTFDLSDEPLDGGVREGQASFIASGRPSERFFTLRPGGHLAFQGESVTAHGRYALPSLTDS